MEAVSAAVSLIGEGLTLAASARRSWKKDDSESVALAHPPGLMQPDVDELGLKILHEPSNDDVSKQIDIIFVHGFFAGRETAWRGSTGSWLDNLLPGDLPQARIMVFGYDVNPMFKFNEAGLILFYEALQRRKAMRSETRPLIFVAHGLGGIVVKAALLHSHELQNATGDATLLLESTICVCFFGTPQRGSSRIGWRQSITQFSNLYLSGRVDSSRARMDKLISDVLNEDDVVRISTRFASAAANLRIISFYEMQSTMTSRGAVRIVAADSAAMKIPMEILVGSNTNHLDMVKFESRHDTRYLKFLHVIENCIRFEQEGMTEPIPVEQQPQSWTGNPTQLETGPSLSEVVFHESAPDDKSASMDLVERERQFLAKVKEDWLEEVMIPDRSPGSCEWIMMSSQFNKWMAGERSPILCICGHSGAGKTVIAKYLATSLRENAEGTFRGLDNASSASTVTNPPRNNAPFQVLSYFFDSRSSSRRKTVNLVRSLIYQLLSNDPRLFQCVYGTPIWDGMLHRTSRDLGSLNQFLALCENMIKDPVTKSLKIVIDALDECESTSQSKLFEFLSAIRGLSKVRIVVTSRKVYRELDLVQLIDLNQSEIHIEKDVNSYIDQEVDKLALRRRLEPALRGDIKKPLKEKSEGNFIWVQLTLQTLRRCKTSKDLLQALKKQSSNIENSFSVYIDMVAEPELMTMLYFVDCARIPLRTYELSALLALSSYCRDNNKDTEISLSGVLDCCPFDIEGELSRYQPVVQVTEGCVALVHQDLHHWLESAEGLERLSISQMSEEGLERLSQGKLPKVKSDSELSKLEKVHAHIARSCLVYIYAASRAQVDPLNFLDYSSCQWPRHLKLSNASSPAISSLAQKLLSNHQDTSMFSTWASNLHRYQSNELPRQSGYHFTIAAFNLCDAFGSLSTIVEGMEDKDDLGQTPLHLAAANDSIDFVRWIREHVNLGRLATLPDKKEGRTPLELAIIHGHLDMTTELRDCVTKIGEPIPYPELIRSSAKAGQRATFKLLLEKANMGQFSDIDVEYATKVAVQFDDLVAFNDIRKRRPDIELRDELLLSAVKSRSEKMVSLLLKQGLDPNRPFGHGDRCLHVAVRLGLQGIVKKLLENDARPNTPNESGQIALHIACMVGAHDVVTLLLEQGAAVDLVDKSGLTALHYGAKYGHLDIIRLLLEWGSNVNIRAFDGQTPLQMAVSEGQMSAVQELLNQGARLGAKDLHTAVLSSNSEMVGVLLRHGANPNEPMNDDIQETALKAAVRTGSTVIEKLLRDS